MNESVILLQKHEGSACFLPDFHQPKPVIASMVILEMLAIMLTISSINTEFYWNQLLFASLYIQWITLTCLVFFRLLRTKVSGLNQTKVAIISYLSILFVTLVIAETTFQVARKINPDLLPFTFGHIEFLVASLVVSAIVGTVALRYLYLRHETMMTIKAEAQAQLMALQARIRPHFLFNSLNTVLGLIRAEPDLAENMLENLAELMRTGLANASMLTTFDEEIALTRRYISMEKLRFGERLLVVFDVKSVPSHCPMPSLSIQPLVENAIYHGIEPLSEGGTIGIEGRYLNGVVMLKITNPVVTDLMGKAVRKGHHIAVDNVRQRLLKHFGNNAMLKAQEKRTEYIVELCIPFTEPRPLG